MGCHWDEVQSLSIWLLGFKVIVIPLEGFRGDRKPNWGTFDAEDVYWLKPRALGDRGLPGAPHSSAVLPDVLSRSYFRSMSVPHL